MSIKTRRNESGIKVGKQRKDIMHANQVVIPPHLMLPWTGVTVAGLGDIPWQCKCDWIEHDGRLEIKFFYRLCPLMREHEGKS